MILADNIIRSITYFILWLFIIALSSCENSNELDNEKIINKMIDENIQINIFIPVIKYIIKILQIVEPNIKAYTNLYNQVIPFETIKSPTTKLDAPFMLHVLESVAVPIVAERATWFPASILYKDEPIE